ncbi:MAG TPA: hypothetical protein VFU88_10205 [Ktedonobacterales bacterium]|nr:hypothetical protein [Ktedonobacterales bacterium]
MAARQRTVYPNNRLLLEAPEWFQTSVAGWMDGSPRYAAFIELHRDKIRKKIRGLRDDEGLRDLACELLVAWRLLADRRCTLAYEPLLAGKTRGPDFALTFKGHLAVNVEVKRLRASVTAARLADAVCDKLGQLPPGAPNALVVCASMVEASANGGNHSFELGAALAALRAAAERSDPALFARHGYRAPADFFRGFLRLSAVRLRVPWEADAPETASALWGNPQARHPLPAALQTALGVL